MTSYSQELSFSPEIEIFRIFGANLSDTLSSLECQEDRLLIKLQLRQIMHILSLFLFQANQIKELISLGK